MIFLTIIFFLSIFFLIYFDKISKKINLYDYPDNIRKFQKVKVSTIGGFIFIIFFNLFIILNYEKLTDFPNFPNLLILESYREIILFQFVITAIYLIGLYDDKYNLRAFNKAISLIILISFFIFFEADSQIKQLKFSFLNETIILKNFSIIFTVLCFFSLIISLNMFDGINGQSFINFLIISLYILTKGYFNEIICLLILLLLFFGYLNLKNKVYLGDNGIHFLGFLFSYLIVKTYNVDNSIYADEIIILLLIPIIDATRLFFVRIYKGLNPFNPDTTHIHHLLVKNYGLNNALIIISLLLIIPYFLMVIKLNYLVIIFLQIFIYLFFVFFLKKNKKQK